MHYVEIHNRSCTNTRAGKTVITEIKRIDTKVCISYFRATHVHTKVISLDTTTVPNISWKIENVNAYFVFMHKSKDKLTAGANVQVGIGSNWYKPRHFMIF